MNGEMVFRCGDRHISLIHLFPHQPHGNKVFTAASVDTATIIMTKEYSDDSIVTVLQSSKFIFSEICKKNQSDWRNNSDLVFNISTENIIALYNCIPLGEICKTYFGIQAFDRKSSISELKNTEMYLPIIDGADIHPYTYAVPKIYFNYLPENIKSGGDWSVYSRERIVVRQIGKLPVVGLCSGGILGSNTLYSIYPKDDTYKLKFILACLNSSFIKKYWSAKYSDNKALFPKIKGFQLKELPIPRVGDDIQIPVITLIEKIISSKTVDANADTSKFETEIDKLLSKAYGLTI